jgi:hypothetical protein
VTAAPGCAGEQKQGAEPVQPGGGVLKANWFAKHRQRRPAVAAVFLDRQAAAGDPSAWSRACASLEAVRAAVKPRGARIVVAVVQVDDWTFVFRDVSSVSLLSSVTPTVPAVHL